MSFHRDDQSTCDNNTNKQFFISCIYIINWQTRQEITRIHVLLYNVLSCQVIILTIQLQEQEILWETVHLPIINCSVFKSIQLKSLVHLISVLHCWKVDLHGLAWTCMDLHELASSSLYLFGWTELWKGMLEKNVSWSFLSVTMFQYITQWILSTDIGVQCIQLNLKWMYIT